ncbi:hypothetical protein LINGRAHAP2_LOCUS15172 [Linum grandiflorum]
MRAGGLIRDSQSHCLASFEANLRRCSVTRADIRRAVFGLHIAWEMGFRSVTLQLDSHVVISCIAGSFKDDLRHLSCIQEARRLINRRFG